jgi:hypothetical protein
MHEIEGPFGLFRLLVELSKYTEAVFWRDFSESPHYTFGTRTYLWQRLPAYVDTALVYAPMERLEDPECDNHGIGGLSTAGAAPVDAH